MYPHINIGTNKLSLVYPYTIDDSLIVDYVIIPGTPDSYKFISDNDTVIQYCMSPLMDGELRFKYDSYLRYSGLLVNYNIQQQCNIALHERPEGVTIEQFLINNIVGQCNELSIGNATFVNSELRNQNRYVPTQPLYVRPASNRPDVDSDRCILRGIQEAVAADHITTGTADHITTGTADYSRSVWNRIIDEINAIDFTTTSSSLGYTTAPSVIHGHSYVPEYIKHYLPDESHSSLLLGAEIEVDCGGEKQEHAKKVLEIMNGSADSEENIYCVHDGSLNAGMEFPTQPGTLGWHKTLPYEEMFKYLDEHGYKAHDTKTCGLHIHINRSYFGEEESSCIGKVIYIVEKFNDEFSALGRRSCRYSILNGYSGEKCKDIYDKNISIGNKYYAINLLHRDTIELRMFKGTLKYSSFMNTLEFVSKLALFVKDHDEEFIEQMVWSDLYETFSPELKEYYNQRVEIESSKKIKERENNSGTNLGETRNTVSLLYEAWNRLESTADDLWAIDRERMYCRYSNAGEVYVHDSVDSYYSARNINYNPDFLSGILLPFDHPVENVTICRNETYEDVPIDKKIKNLKNRMKHERNYLAKQKLRDELQRLQTERNKKRKANDRSN